MGKKGRWKEGIQQTASAGGKERKGGAGQTRESEAEK